MRGDSAADLLAEDRDPRDVGPVRWIGDRAFDPDDERVPWELGR